MRRAVAAQKIRDKRNTRNKRSYLFGINRMFWVILFCLFLSSFVYGICWVSGFWSYYRMYVEQSALKFTAKCGFVVDDILVEGRQRSSKDAIISALEIDTKSPIFTFDPWRAKENLEKIPWVRSSLVERRLPNVIYVKISERHPYLRWQNAQVIHLIDEQGQVIVLDRYSPSERAQILREFSHLPLFVGPKASEKGSEFLMILNQFPRILKHVTASSFVNERRWTIYLDKCIEVRLPSENVTEALHVLNTLETRDMVSSRDIKMIDLRFLPKIILRPQKTQEVKSSTSSLARVKKSKDI